MTCELLEFRHFFLFEKIIQCHITSAFPLKGQGNSITLTTIKHGVSPTFSGLLLIPGSADLASEPPPLLSFLTFLVTWPPARVLTCQWPELETGQDPREDELHVDLE